MPPKKPKQVGVLLQTVSLAVALMLLSELEAMQVYSPESWNVMG